uniref:Uncharacterized protein n=1 Tax=Meloidogyne javanica TaxID=6303 RepID=A0A915MD12_MELJA
MRYKQVPDEAIKPNAKNFNFALFDKQHGEFNEQIEEKLSNKLPISLYLSDHCMRSTLVICLTTMGMPDFSTFLNYSGIINLKRGFFWGLSRKDIMTNDYDLALL